MPRLALICVALLALVLGIPLLMPGSLLWFIPAFFLAPLAPWLCVRASRRTLKDEDWGDNSDRLQADTIDTVCIDPALLIGRRWLQARVWLPFDAIEGERFRSHTGAAAMSAAIALTESCAADERSVTGFAREDIREWVSSLGVNADNFRRLHPRVDDARYCGYPGVIVMDGKELRAYFVGGATLVQECRRVLDGSSRIMMRDDRERLRDLPADALCYATAPVIDGKLGEVCYLGAVQPVARYSVSAEALEAGRRLHRRGIRVTLGREDPWMLQNARDMGVEWPEDDGAPNVFRPRALHMDAEQPRDFDRPVREWLLRARQEAYHCVLCALFGLMLWPASLLEREPWWFLLALLTMCLSILIAKDHAFPTPPLRTVRSFVTPLAPGFLLPLIVWFFIEVIAKRSGSHAGAMMAVTEGCVYALWRLSLIASQPAGHRTVGIGAGVCLIAVSLATLLLNDVKWISAAFGGVAGMLIAIAVIITHRYLSPEVEDGR